VKALNTYSCSEAQVCKEIDAAKKEVSKARKEVEETNKKYRAATINLLKISLAHLKVESENYSPIALGVQCEFHHCKLEERVKALETANIVNSLNKE